MTPYRKSEAKIACRPRSISLYLAVEELKRLTSTYRGSTPPRLPFPLLPPRPPLAEKTIPTDQAKAEGLPAGGRGETDRPGGMRCPSHLREAVFEFPAFFNKMEGES